MNEAYAPLGISFNTVDIDITVNNAWAAAAQGSSAERSMKSALRQGSYADLNLYFTSDLAGGILGFCYFPLASPTSSDLVLDGCMCLASSMPGSTATNYDEGYTAVHEAGHWFGLYHVFQGQSCSGSGDYVSDTPIQRTATSGCPASQDSCPNQSGADSIHNFMVSAGDTLDRGETFTNACAGLFLRQMHDRVHEWPEPESERNLLAISRRKIGRR